MVKITVETKLGNFCVTHTLSMSELSSLDFSSEFVSTTFATRGISPMSSDPIPEELLSHSLKEKGSGSPWWASGLDSTLPIQGASVQSLVPGCTKLRVPMLQLSPGATI